jgi:hypothetical protein
VRKALSWPARQIAINAGEDGSVIVGKILDKDQYSYGFDGQTGEYGNLVSKGIIDPTKVVRVAIQNAASIAALLITTEAMVAEVPKKNATGGMPAGGGKTAAAADPGERDRFWHAARAKLGKLHRLTPRDIDGIEKLLALKVPKPMPAAGGPFCTSPVARPAANPVTGPHSPMMRSLRAR